MYFFKQINLLRANNTRANNTLLSMLLFFSAILFSSNNLFAGFVSSGGKRGAVVKCHYHYEPFLKFTLYSDGGYHAFEPYNADKPKNHIDVSGVYDFKIINKIYQFSRISTKHTFMLRLENRDKNDVLHGTWRDTKIPGANGKPLSIVCQLVNDFDDIMGVSSVLKQGNGSNKAP